MSSLVIDHGNPWWLSPNVWVVPISNPGEGSPGEINPAVGQQYYLTANVRNPTNANVLDAMVYFYWANPSLGVITSVNANPIGKSSVSVNAGQTVNTLELAPWSPVFQNGGHECVIAAVVEGGGSPPPILDGDSDPTVAQHNLGVVQSNAHAKGRFHYPFQVCNPARIERSFTVAAYQADLTEARLFLKVLPDQGKGAAAKVEHLGFVLSPCPEPSEYEKATPVIEGVKLAPFSCTGLSLVGILSAGTALIHVTQTAGGKIVGGLSVLVLGGRSSHDRHS